MAGKETNVCGNAGDDEVLAPCRLNSIDDALLVPRINCGAFDSLHAVQNIGELGDKRSPHFLRGCGHDNWYFEREHCLR